MKQSTNRFPTVSRVYSDVSFGNTSALQDSGTTKIIIDLQKVYNESNYVFDFVNDYYNNNSIANFFGFMNSTVYEPYSIYSNYNTELTNNIVVNNNKYPFIVDDSNNYLLFFIIMVRKIIRKILQ
jgi:hypothetical protein